MLKLSTIAQEEYIVGTGIKDFTRLLDGSLPHNIGTYGYVHYKEPIDTTKTDSSKHIFNGVHLPLKSRVLTIKHPKSNSQFVYVLLDMAFASDNIRRSILEKIRVEQPDFESAWLMITATHTHSAPAGFSDYLGYELVAPGYQPEFVETVATRTFEAIQQAWKNESGMDLVFSESEVPLDVPIAYSRKALPAYNNNPEVEEYISIEENYKATDRLWQTIAFKENDALHSTLHFFGAHPNRIGADIISADTRGAASDLMEAELPEDGLALFAQNCPGDIDGEDGYRSKVDSSNRVVFHPSYYKKDAHGHLHYIGSELRVFQEAKYLKQEAVRSIEAPTEQFSIAGAIDCELIYVDMSQQQIPKGKYAKTLHPHDYYTNDYYLWGGLGKVFSLFNPKTRIARTAPPTIGLGAIARLDDKMLKVVLALERSLRHARLGLSAIKDFDKAQYVWQMYRSQGNKTVMIEGGHYLSAIGFPIGGKMYHKFSKFDMVLLELSRDNKMGLHEEHTLYPTIVPIQIAIIGNVAILGISGEPGNIAGQRIERAVLEHLKARGVKRVIGNGYANENTGYIFTPEEYPSQFYPTQCGFVLYGKWTEPAFRYRFEQLAKLMLLEKAEREQHIDRSIQPPVFSKEWYEKASGLELLPWD